MDEITLLRQVGPEKSKASLSGLLAAQKIQKFKYMSRAQFSSELDFLFFLNARNNVLYHNQLLLKLPKTANL